MGESSQKPIKIDGELWAALEEWLETEDAKKIGFHSKAQFATQAVRELLKEYMGQVTPRIELQNKIEELVEHIKKIERMYAELLTPAWKEKLTHNNFRSVIVKDTYIEIFDDGIRNGIPVKITYDDKKLHCEECESFNCNHVKHVWSIEHISKQLEERGLTVIEKTCPKCGTVANKTEVEDVFGYRKSSGKVITQSWCRYCRTEERKKKKQLPSIDKYF